MLKIQRLTTKNFFNPEGSKQLPFTEALRPMLKRSRIVKALTELTHLQSENSLYASIFTTSRELVTTIHTNIWKLPFLLDFFHNPDVTKKLFEERERISESSNRTELNYLDLWGIDNKNTFVKNKKICRSGSIEYRRQIVLIPQIGKLYRFSDNSDKTTSCTLESHGYGSWTQNNTDSENKTITPTSETKSISFTNLQIPVNESTEPDKNLNINISSNQDLLLIQLHEPGNVDEIGSSASMTIMMGLNDNSVSIQIENAFELLAKMPKNSYLYYFLNLGEHKPNSINETIRQRIRNFIYIDDFLIFKSDNNSRTKSNGDSSTKTKKELNYTQLIELQRLIGFVGIITKQMSIDTLAPITVNNWYGEHPPENNYTTA